MSLNKTSQCRNLGDLLDNKVTLTTRATTATHFFSILIYSYHAITYTKNNVYIHNISVWHNANALGERKQRNMPIHLNSQRSRRKTDHVQLEHYNISSHIYIVYSTFILYFLLLSCILSKTYMVTYSSFCSVPVRLMCIRMDNLVK